jgi:hypothetical protein
MKTEQNDVNGFRTGVYRMQLHGAMCTPSFDWSGELSISMSEEDQAVRVTLLVNPDSLRGFLQHFWSYDLSILPVEGLEDELLQRNELEAIAEISSQWLPTVNVPVEYDK